MKAIIFAFIIGFLLGGLASFFVYNERDIDSTRIINHLNDERLKLIRKLRKYEGDDDK